MRIEAIVWLDVIVDKLAVKHGVRIEEVEQVFGNNSRFRFVENGTREGEDVYLYGIGTNRRRTLSLGFVYSQI